MAFQHATFRPICRTLNTAALIAESGTCDILINNAGIQHVAPIDEFPIDSGTQSLRLTLVLRFTQPQQRCQKCAQRGGAV